MLQDAYTAWWTAWLILLGLAGLGGFAVIEYKAVRWELRHGSGATLSAHLRNWFRFAGKDRGWQRRRIYWLTLCALWVFAPVALSVHLLGWF